MSKREIVGYWVATALFCLAMGASGILNLLRVGPAKEGLAALGYPEYLMTILGVAKLLGVVALLLPGLGLLKEWAYAGFTFDLLGAAASHAFVGDVALEIATPIIMLIVGGVSYVLRPPSRQLRIPG